MQDGRTALMMAAFDGHDGIVDLLVKAGASLDVQSKVGGQRWWTHRIHPTDAPHSCPWYLNRSRSRPSCLTAIDPSSF